MLDVIGTKDLQYIKSIETEGHGVFSAWADNLNQRAYVGCHDGHMYTVDLTTLELVAKEGYTKLRQGIYDIVQLPQHPQILMCVQHFGFVDFVSTADQ